jgi:O-antigen/teichoic acid export membrane protein
MESSLIGNPPPKKRGWIVVSDKVQFLLTTCGTQGVAIATSLIMARLLTPTDYGVLGLVLALPGLICSLGDFGVMKALIQIRDAPEKVLEHTALALTIAINGFYFLVRFGAGIILALMRHDHRIVALGLLTGLTSFLGGIYSFQMTVLNRAMRFRAESFQNVVFSLAQAVTGIGLAWAGWGVFALALQPMGAQLFANVAMLRHWRLEWPKQFNRGLARRMLHFGGQLTFADYMGNLSDIIMGLFVGGVFGTFDLGLYAKAGQVKDMIGHNLIAAFDRLMYPIMAASRADMNRLRQIFLRGAAGGVFFCWFGWAWCLATGRDLIPAVLGHQWGGAIPLLMIASFDLLTASMMLNGIVLTQVIGQPKRWMVFQGAWLTLTLIAATAAWHWGLIAVAAAVYFVQGVVALSFFRWAIGYLHIPVLVVANRMKGLMLAAVISLLAMHFLGADVLEGWGQKLRLLVESGLGGLVYLGVLSLVDSETIKEIRQMALGW